ncbi:MAG: hypothetical protein A2X49_02385 [Lentisphaerae bacterium GWF2_52_8]|nr:MAG: hypothetical protein A2X49_02385 [Lentisphaerae bacterium GWF2_52_8]
MAFLNSTDTVKLKKMEALELTCISVTEILKKEELLKGLLPLDCYIPHPDGGARWQHQRFKFGQEKIAIGNSRKAEIPVQGKYVEEIHVLLQAFMRHWHVIEAGVFNALMINGIKKRQETIKPATLCVLQVGATPIVLNSALHEKPPLEHPGRVVREFSVSTPKGEKHFKFGNTVLLGSHEICGLHVEGEDFIGGISAFRKKLYFFPFPGKTPLFQIDGQAVTGLTPLIEGSQLSVNGVSMEFGLLSPELQSENWNEGIPSELAMDLCLLEIDKPHGEGEKILLVSNGETITIGRAPSCEISVNSANISREHAKLKVSSNSLIIEDCYSRNGTWVNGERISKSCSCRPGDMISFGNKNYLFCYSSLK